MGFRIEKELVRSVAVPERGERHHRPDRGMRILAAVLADPRGIAPDVAGVDGRVVERRGEQENPGFLPLTTSYCCTIVVIQ